MGLWETLSTWLEPPYTVLYQCGHCGSSVADPGSSCPECGSELDPDATPKIMVDYWGPM